MSSPTPALAAALATLTLATAVHAGDIAVQAGTLLDGVTDTARHDVTILVHDGRIATVTEGYSAPTGSRVIDLRQATVTPGFIDCHVHVTGKLPSRTKATEDWVTHAAIDRAFDGAVFAAAMLQQGFTSVRDVGGGDESVAVKRAIEAGKIRGPRMWVSLEPLGPTAGHGDPRSALDPDLSHPGWDLGIVDTPDAARIRVREHRRRGADLIKIMPSGGIASTGDDPRQQLMTDAEISTAIATAHSLGMKVAAHAYGPESIAAAVRAHVDSIEHGSFATAETFALMKTNGTYLVPTLTVFEVFYQVARDHPELLRPGTAPKEMANDLLPKKNFPNALKSGVKIVYGTDLGEGAHSMEFRLLIEGGMTPMEAITAATRTAAELLGASDRIGSVQAGRYADLVAVAGDPLQTPELLGKISFVMKGGQIFRRNGAAAGVE